MKIGVDVSTWHNGRGFGRFTRELVTALVARGAAHDWVLFSDTPLPPVARATVRIVRQQRPVTEAAVENDRRGIADLLRFTSAVARERLDLLFYPAVYSWFPCPPRLPNLVTLHDAIPERFPELVFPERRARWLWRAKVRLADLQATRILTVSESARSEIATYAGIDASRIDVTTEGPAHCYRAPRDESERRELRARLRRTHGFEPEAPVLVYVGGFARHKNVGVLLAALAKVLEDAATAPRLILVGDPRSHGFGSTVAELERTIAADARLRPAVRFAGFVPDPALAELLAGADALAFPSLAEGFGLPAVEAMACGTPVLASTGGSLPEVVGDAGLLFDPTDVDDVARALRGFLSSPALRERLRGAALQRAARFTWERAADLALQSLHRCAGRPSGAAA